MVCGRLPLLLLLLGLSQVLVHAHFFSVRRPRKHGGFGFSLSGPHPWRTPTLPFRRLSHSHESRGSSESRERPARFQFGFVHRHRPGSEDSLWQRLERDRRKLEWLGRRKPFGGVRPYKWPSFPWQDSGIQRQWASSWREAKDRVHEALCALFGRHCPHHPTPPSRRRPVRPNTTPCPPPVTRPTSTPDPTTPPVTLPTLTSTSPGEEAEVNNNNNEQGSGGISEIEVRGITETAVQPEGEQRATDKPEVLLTTPFRKSPGGSTGSAERARKENESGEGGRRPASTRPLPSPHAGDTGTTERWGKENEEGGPTTRGKLDTRPTTTTTTTAKRTTTEEYFEIPDIVV